jgi:hypothetical protein
VHKTLSAKHVPSFRLRTGAFWFAASGVVPRVAICRGAFRITPQGRTDQANRMGADGWMDGWVGGSVGRWFVGWMDALCPNSFGVFPQPPHTDLSHDGLPSWNSSAISMKIDKDGVTLGSKTIETPKSSTLIGL